MKWLITGGAGFIGANTAKYLLDAGEKCIVTDNFHRAGAKLNQKFLTEKLGLETYYLDVRFKDQVDAFVKAHPDVDVVLHLAGQVSLVASIQDPRYDFETNALGTFNVLEAVRTLAPQARVIYSSSNKVYGDLEAVRVEELETRYCLPDYPDGLPETLPIELHGGYSCSKGSADQYVRDYRKAYGIKTASLRQSSVYGGNQYASEDQGWVAYFVQMGVQNTPYKISGTGKQVRDLLHVSDLYECFRAIASQPEDSPAWGEAYNIGGGAGSSLSLLELFDLLRKRYNFELNYTKGPARMGDQKVFICDTAKADKLLGWKQKVGIEEGLDELVSWSSGQWSKAPSVG